MRSASQPERKGCYELTDTKRHRYSVLAPIPIETKLELASLAVEFFSPVSYRQMCKVIGIDDGEAIRPLSGRDFLKYLKAMKALNDPDQYLWQIRTLLRDMCSADILTDMGIGSDVLIGRHYYYQRELTNLERMGKLWLAPALGPEYIYRVYSAATCQIIGTLKGEGRAGTALIVAPNWLLTCAHVIRDMAVSEQQYLRDQHFTVTDTLAHESIDIGLVKTLEELPVTPGLSFRDPRVGEPVFTIGYPRIPLSKESSLILHRGEITNPEMTMMSGDKIFTYSAIARPGNSGGPIVGEHGSVIGVVTHELAQDCERPGSPFFAGIGTAEIATSVRALAPDLVLPVETYE